MWGPTMSNGLFSVLACSHISAWPLYLWWQESTYSQKPMNVLARVRSGKSLMGVPFLQSPLQTDPGVRRILCPMGKVTLQADISPGGYTKPALLAHTLLQRQ